MELDELKKRIYQKDGQQLEDRPKPPENFDLGHLEQSAANIGAEWSRELAAKQRRSKNTRRNFLIGVAALGVAVLAVVGWFAWRLFFSFDKDQITFELFGQDRIVSGEEVTYVVKYKNNTNTVLNNASVSLVFSAGSIPEDSEVSSQGGFPMVKKTIGTIQGNASGQVEFKARILGDKDSEQKFVAKMEYQPSNVNSSYANEAEFTSTIISVPLVLNFEIPDKIVSGQTLNFSLKYLNTSEAVFGNSVIKIEFPDGFTFDSALPSPGDEKDTWSMSEIGSHEEGKILLKGNISGNDGDSKVFKAQIGAKQGDEFIPYAQTMSSPVISVSPLYVEQTITNPEKANPGEQLKYKLKYKNTTDVTIGPVFITLKIDSKVVDPLTVAAGKGGFFSSADNTITWNTAGLSDLESLAPGAEGELDFSFRLKDKYPVSSYADKNFTVITTANIDSQNVPLALTGTQISGRNQLTVNVNSKLSLKTKGYAVDSILPNSGPIPPKVGQKTTYTIYWQVLNVSNELSDVVVESYLPSYVQWLGNIYPKNEDISYDSGSGKVSWKIGKLAAATGILSPVKQVVFQVGVIPSINQVGDAVVVLKSSKATGKDTFTNIDLTSTTIELKTDMPDDPTMNFDKGRVSQ